MLPDASSEHVDQSIGISVRDGHESFFPELLEHPNLTDKGINHAFACAVHGQYSDILRLMLDSGRVPMDEIIDSMLL